MARITINSPSLEKETSIDVRCYKRGYWTDENDNEITESMLGKTVYFHIETIGMPDDEKVEMQLYSLRQILGLDYLKPDRKEFDEMKITKTVTFKNNHAKLSLSLDKEWEKDFHKDHSRFRLYWQIKFKGSQNPLKMRHGKTILYLPVEEEKYLHVNEYDQLLHIKPSIYDPDLPEIMDIDGTIMELLVQVATVAVKQVHEKAVDYIAEEITGIALGRMEKGHMVDNKLKVHTKTRTVENALFYTQEGDIYFAKRGRNFGYRGGGTTKGIDQFEYFSTHGTKVKILGFLKRSSVASDMYDIFSYAKEAGENDYPDLPLSGIGGAIAGSVSASQAASTATMTRVVLDSEIKRQLGTKAAQNRAKETLGTKAMEEAIPKEAGLAALGVSMGITLLGVMADMIYQEGEGIMEAATQSELKVAKEEGLDAIKKFVEKHKDYKLMQINHEIASRILHGEFKEIYEVEKATDYIDKKNIYILYREMEHPISQKDIVIIETFIIDTDN